MPNGNKVINGPFPKKAPVISGFDKAAATGVAIKPSSITFGQYLPANMDPRLKAMLELYLYNEYESKSISPAEVVYNAQVVQAIDSTLKAQGKRGVADIVQSMTSTAEKYGGRLPPGYPGISGMASPIPPWYINYSISRYSNADRPNTGTGLLAHELWHALAGQEGQSYNDPQRDEPLATAAGQFIERGAPTVPNRPPQRAVWRDGRNLFAPSPTVPSLYQNLPLIEARRRAIEQVPIW